MGDYCKSPNPQQFDEIKETIDEVVHNSLKDIVQEWETIYGTSSKGVVKELTSELAKCLEDFWKQQSLKLSDIRNECLKNIEVVGQEAVRLERVLGLEQRVCRVSNNIPLVQMEEQLQSLLDSYQELKKETLKEYFQLQTKEAELCAILDMETPKSKVELPHSGSPQMGHYVPTASDMTEFKKRIQDLEQLKEQLEYDFEEAKAELREVMEECNFAPFNQRELFAFGQAQLAMTTQNLKILQKSVATYRKKKDDLMAESQRLRDQIDILSKKMFKDHSEIREFLSENSGFTEAVINRLKEKLKSLKDERKSNLKELIANSRTMLTELWKKCCYSEEQIDEFKPFHATRLSEEVLEIHELEIEKLENYYENCKRIFELAEEHRELWDLLLHLEEQANNKDRLFNNRGGCLLKEEKERKLLQKKVPAVKAKLMARLQSYKEETGRDFLYYGEPLELTIEMKELERESTKQTERVLRKAANNADNLMKSRVGHQTMAGVKRRAAVTPQDQTKARRIETASSSKSTSSASSCKGTLVRKEENTAGVRAYLTTPTPRKNRMPAASTPQNGSLSYESFQEHIEKSKYAAHNSTRCERQRALRPKNLNQTRTVVEKTTPFRTPKTPGRTFTKTPTKTPSKIPFRIPTGSKIPSQVPPVSPRRKPALSTTKLPIIF
ncbi:protein regulator of cytokinesis 1-like isoform X1 [Macrosteles quadrilineatus]|uniref:protein regulator of cytokinesis 1-like isoform X1 n=1 Tax=Macrosteles quadrilineatus TaxID=74068 RepID=UPI0023E2B9A9|nr:protein regulator of cytokinesis 1-like isoform X1 [Macrosteles quadrilineatus]